MQSECLDADPWTGLEMSPRIRAPRGVEASAEGPPRDVAPLDTVEFRLNDRELKLRLAGQLYDHAGFWLERLGHRALIVGSVRGEDSRTRFAAAMAFSEGLDGARAMIFVDFNPLTQRRRRVPLLVDLDRSEPIAELVLPFQLLLEAVSISSPDCPGTRQIGLRQFGEIANNSEAPD